MKIRPITTLFLLTSVDGKISTGASDELDVDRDYPLLDGVKQGLHQYYEIERTTDLWSLNSGRVQAKIGINEKPFLPKGIVSFVVIDNHNLERHGVEYFSKMAKTFVLVTSNPNHPAFKMNIENVNIIYQDKFSPKEMFEILYEKYGCEQITIQTGGTLNEIFLREKLFDYVDIVIAPVLVGGLNTPSLIDGQSIISREDLYKLGILKLEKCEVLKDSYLRLKYKVVG